MKVPIFCSLIPAELLAACGYELHLVSAEEIAAQHGGAHYGALHDNLCSYAKGLCNYFEQRHGDYDLIVIPASCDALKKLYSALKARIGAERLYLLDVPKNQDAHAHAFFAASIAKLRDRASRGEPECRMPAEPREGASADAVKKKRHAIGIVGANAPSAAIDQLLCDGGAEVVHLNHCLMSAAPDAELAEVLDRDGLDAYAEAFWRKNRCPRTNDDAAKALICARIQEEGIDGVVVNAFKFCDYQPFDYRHLKRELGHDYPMMLIEHEFGAGAEGQMKTRIEAFLEKIRGVSPAEGPRRQPTPGAAHVVGIDSGSNATKLVCLDERGEIVAALMAPTGASVAKSAEGLLARLESECGIGREKIARIVGTGYGRENLAGCDATVTEISCHALGAHYRLRHGATIIDVGGQDSKAIRIDPEGNVIRFAMNDKCAAGTGKFLEVMAQKLEVSLPELAQLSLAADSSVPISSMCSVFAESEVISLIAEGKSKEGIALGVHKAIAERTASLCRRIAGEPPYYMAGGVAKNAGLVRELGACLGSEVRVLEDPQMSGALGAAMMARKGLS
jgi:predicted CoA-substrate-specific enzyme activase